MYYAPLHGFTGIVSKLNNTILLHFQQRKMKVLNSALMGMPELEYRLLAHGPEQSLVNLPVK